MLCGVSGEGVEGNRVIQSFHDFTRLMAATASQLSQSVSLIQQVALMSDVSQGMSSVGFIDHIRQAAS
jgi:hypothetical protein